MSLVTGYAYSWRAAEFSDGCIGAPAGVLIAGAHDVHIASGGGKGLCVIRPGLDRLGDGTDIITVDVRGCGSSPRYQYAVRYDPLVLGDAAEYWASQEEILPETGER